MEEKKIRERLDRAYFNAPVFKHVQNLNNIIVKMNRAVENSGSEICNECHGTQPLGGYIKTEYIDKDLLKAKLDKIIKEVTNEKR